MHGRRGEDGQPLPSGGRVFRFAHKPKDFAGDRQPLPVGFNGFELSTDEKVGRPLRLSVFSTDLTTTAQGWRIAGAKHNLVLLLSIDGIRSLKLALDNPGIDVVWHHMDIPLPGIDGHAGITGWDVDKVQRRYLRMKLADTSNVSEFRGDQVSE